MKKKFLVYSYFGEILDLAMCLKNAGHEVCFFVQNDEYKKIGEGMIEKITEWYPYMGQNYIWVFDGCENGKLQDWLRSKGEAVFGGSEKGDKLENNRQLAQDWFKRVGFKQPFSKNFKKVDDAIKFVQEKKEKRWIIKQNGDAPKSINHMGKFENSEDMLYHLEELKKHWSEIEFGKFDCDLMEVVEGLEVAASAFFNGKEFLKNKKGNVVGYLNFEEKKETAGGLGETVGEMGTTFYGTDDSQKLFKDILGSSKIVEVLRNSGFRGVFDINGCLTKDGYVAFEATCRFGVPATAYEFCEAMTNPAEVIEIIARGENKPIEIKEGWGMVMVLAAKPYPVEADLDEGATSLGEKLWITKNDKVQKDFDAEQKKHIWLYNFEYSDKKDYKVVTKCGYLFTVTSTGKSIADSREKLIQYIKDNVYISGMKYRTDIGQRVEDFKSEKLQFIKK